MKREKVIEKFNEILEKKDPQNAWDFYDLNFSEFTQEEETLMQIQLFKEPWHELHENLASGFQYSRDPLAVDILYQNAFREELDIFDYKPLARKCSWALSDIGTDKAKNYLVMMAQSKDNVIAGFAKKRLNNWDLELYRKGQRISSNSGLEWDIKVHHYPDYNRSVPQKGSHIIAYQTDSNIVVYQAYKQSIAEYSVKNQYLGGEDFSYSRMSWIKPNFLWMMYRSGWADKENQERILAIWISKKDFEEILSQAVISSFHSDLYDSVDTWKKDIENSKVRLQWDPDHDPYGNKVERRAIQIGLKGTVLETFAKEKIKKICDITDFVKKQKLYILRKQLDKLLLPTETVYCPKNERIKTTMGLNQNRP